MLDECILKYMYIPIYLKLRAPSAGHTLHAPSVSIKSALFIYAHFIVFFLGNLFIHLKVPQRLQGRTGRGVDRQ